MKLKKAMALMMTGALAASALTACSSGTDTGNTQAQGETSGTTASGETGKDGEKTVINIWSKDRHDCN